MNQIAAALLVLAASICGYSATIRPDSDGFGGLMGLIAIGLGLWGAMSLLTSSLRERERFWDEETSQLPPIGTTALNGLRSLATGSNGQRAGAEYRLSAETHAQVAAAAHLRGQNRAQIVEETLRRHLPRNSTNRVA